MAYRRTERMEARLASNRERILRAARETVAERGFRDAEIAAIASAAGVATGTIHRYFPSGGGPGGRQNVRKTTESALSAAESAKAGV